MNQHILPTRRRLLAAMGLGPAALGLALSGCEQPEDPALPVLGDALETEDPALGVVPPPGTLDLTLLGDLDTGATITFDVGGAPPGATVFLAGAYTVGVTGCPTSVGGVCIDLTNPKLLGQGTANASGDVFIDVILPHEIPDGTSLNFQAVVLGSAPDTSNLFTDLTTHPPRTCGEHPFLDGTNYTTLFDTLACGPIPPSGQCPDVTTITYNQSQWLFTHATGQSPNAPWGGYDLALTCFEDTVEDACCYGGQIYQFAIGRPFKVDGEARTAAEACDPSWVAALPEGLDASHLPRATRRRLAEAWRRVGHGEHASVAAFSRFVMQLMALGAPADLVSDATAAVADEIRHARDAYAFASLFAGHTVSAGALDMDRALEDGADLRAIVLDVVREGCIAETLAASQAAAAADAATVPAIRDALTRVAEDEGRHAQLGWRFVRWALSVDPTLAEPVAQAFSEAGAGLEPCALDPDAQVLRDHGVLCEADMRAVGRTVLREVVQPCARALLADVGHDAPRAVAV